MLTELTRLLDQEKNQYVLLLQLAEQKRVVLGQEDVAGLAKISQAEADLLAKISGLEKQRSSLAAAWSDQQGLGREASLSEIIRHTSQPHKERLLLLQAAFNELVQKIAFINEANKKLIQTQLSYTSFFLSALTGPAGTGNTYDRAGALRDSQLGRLKIMDRQV